MTKTRRQASSVADLYVKERIHIRELTSNIVPDPKKTNSGSETLPVLKMLIMVHTLDG